MAIYRILKKQVFSKRNLAIIPIRLKDRYDIMKWRNDQIYHLRQNEILTKEDQDIYFNSVIANLFEQDFPDQVIFSFVDNDVCVGYGGLVHINWHDQNAEISFLIDTNRETSSFDIYWTVFLSLIEEVAFLELGLYKIYTYAYDLRPKLFSILEKADYKLEAVLKHHHYHKNEYLDVKIHSKFQKSLCLRNAILTDSHLAYKWVNNSEIRKYSFNRSSVSWKDHNEWFYHKVFDRFCEYYFLAKDAICIGSIRFDILVSDCAQINYLIAPEFQGKGYGRVILELGINRLLERRIEIRKVFGFVIENNIASIKIFNGLGFNLVSRDGAIIKYEKSF